MPHSLRAKLKGLNYKKILTDRELERLCKALDNENVLDKIRAEIEKVFCMSVVTNELRTPMEVKTEILQIIDKYKAESEGHQKMGCEGCIYEKTGNNSTYPCSHCGRCYTDKYKAESEE